MILSDNITFEKQTIFAGTRISEEFRKTLAQDMGDSGYCLGEMLAWNGVPLTRAAQKKKWALTPDVYAK